MMHGDVPETHKALVPRLIKAEKEVDDISMVSSKKAQVYVCLAYDWFDIGMEEEGNRLLEKAETTHPKYFDVTIIRHMKEDPVFESLVKKIESELRTMALGHLGK